MLQNILESYLKGELQKLPGGFVKEMLERIGDPDGYLRDKLIYNSFVKMIFSEETSINDLNELLKLLLQDGYLFYRIGESGTDSVFRRSFSVLVIAAIIEKDAGIGKLNKELVQLTANKTVQYMKEENDIRGYVDNKGWAHAVAHGADALAALSKHPNIDSYYITEILAGVESVLLKAADYLDEEEERLAAVIDSIVTHKQYDVLRWLKHIAAKSEGEYLKDKNSVEQYHIMRNVKYFFKAVYIYFNARDVSSELKTAVLSILKKWMFIQ